MDERRGEIFKKMALRLANHLDLSRAEHFSEMPEPLQMFFLRLKYADIILPLIIDDLKRGNRSAGWLSIKYSIPRTTVIRLISTKCVQNWTDIHSEV